MAIFPGCSGGSRGGWGTRAKARAVVPTSPPPAGLQRLGVPRQSGKRPVGAPEWVRLSSARVQHGAISAGSSGLPLGCAAPGGTGTGVGVDFGSWANLVLELIVFDGTVVPRKGVVPLLQGLAQGLEGNPTHPYF